MGKLYTCVNCEKKLKEAPLKVIEGGSFAGLILCGWQCMREYAEHEVAQQEAVGDE